MFPLPFYKQDGKLIVYTTIYVLYENVVYILLISRASIANIPSWISSIQCFRDISMVFPAVILMPFLHDFSVLFPRVGSEEHSIRVTTSWINNRKIIFDIIVLKIINICHKIFLFPNKAIELKFWPFLTIWICPSKLIICKQDWREREIRNASSMAGMAKEKERKKRRKSHPAKIPVLSSSLF